MFSEYRAHELSEVSTVGTYRLKLRGSDGSESKWLTVTSTELERIIAVLEPEDYKANVPAEVRVKLPDIS